MASWIRPIRDGEYTSVIYGLIREGRYTEAASALADCSRRQGALGSRASLSLLAYCHYQAQVGNTCPGKACIDIVVGMQRATLMLWAANLFDRVESRIFKDCLYQVRICRTHHESFMFVFASKLCCIDALKVLSMHSSYKGINNNNAFSLLYRTRLYIYVHSVILQSSARAGEGHVLYQT